jgi:outer membrane protein
MKNILILALLCWLNPITQASELKIAVVDVQKVMDEFHKTKDVQVRLNERKAAFEKELSEIKKEGQKLFTEANDLKNLSAENTLSEMARKEKQDLYQVKLKDIQALSVKMNEFEKQRSFQLQDQFQRALKGITAEIQKATSDYAISESYDLVLNINSQSPMTSDAIFASRHVEDITSKLILVLNSPEEKKETATK